MKKAFPRVATEDGDAAPRTGGLKTWCHPQRPKAKAVPQGLGSWEVSEGLKKDRRSKGMLLTALLEGLKRDVYTTSRAADESASLKAEVGGATVRTDQEGAGCSAAGRVHQHSVSRGAAGIYVFMRH